MKSLLALCFYAVVCSALGAPEIENHALLVHSQRDLDLVGDTSKLIEELVANLRKSAQEAMDAVGTFTVGLKDEAVQIREKIVDDIQKFRVRVNEAMENVIDRISNTSTVVRECVESYRGEAVIVFNETMADTLACIDVRIAEVSEPIQELATLAKTALEEAGEALEEMKKCTEDNTNLLVTGACLGKIVVQTEYKSVSFIAQTAILIGRINLDIASLSAALEVCAGSRLIHTGILTGKIVIQIGTCSVTSAFNTIIGKPIEQ